MHPGTQAGGKTDIETLVKAVGCSAEQENRSVPGISGTRIVIEEILQSGYRPSCTLRPAVDGT